jgi:hypothetical protein
LKVEVLVPKIVRLRSRSTTLYISSLRLSLTSSLRTSPADGAIGSSSIPSAPPIFNGREETVDEIVQNITTKEPARVVVLGTGGVGKVSFVFFRARASHTLTSGVRRL